jgi:prolyl-tRNA synthetase
LVLEIGGRDAASGQVSVLRRHRLWNESGKVDFHAMERDQFVAAAAQELECVQRELHEEALARRDAQIHRGATTFAEVEAFFAENNRYPGWVELGWSKPTGAALEAVVAKLKALKLTIRNTPMAGEPVSGTCPFTGEPAVEKIYVARAY